MTQSNPNARLEAFCDGVFAIAMTLLIIDVKIPSMEEISSTAALWHALRLLAPTVFAFLLSFGIILITWVNHHAALKLMDKTSAQFIYANGFLLLAVVSIPFPTSLLGAFLLTDHAAPAVVLYNAVLVMLAVGWLLLGTTALRDNLPSSPTAAAVVLENYRHGRVALALYSVLAIAALWFPLPVAVITTLSWIFWLVLGVRMKHV